MALALALALTLTLTRIPVVLVNLLVAMTADTYSRVRENSQIEALAARYRRSLSPGMPTMDYRVLIA